LQGVDIVHVMIPFPAGVKVAQMARKRGIPVTAGFHCQAENFTAHLFNAMHSKIINRLVYKHFYRNLYRHVNAIHYPTQFIRDIFEKTIKRKTNGYVISNGVNEQYIKKEIARIPPYDEKFNILFIGRLSKEKSHHLLIKAVAKSKYRDQIRLIFAGQGPRKRQIIEKISKLRLEPAIIQFFPREELIDTINQCDLYVHPSTAEIEAIACLEAIKCGLVPVISDSEKSATNAFALSDKNLFKHHCAQDLADRIDYWIEHPAEKEKASRDYLDYASNFAQDVCLKQMRDMLQTYTREENYTPKKIYYYKDELNDDFANHGITAKKIPANYRYIRRCPFYNTVQFLLYNLVARPVAKVTNKAIYKQKIVNHLTVDKKEIKGAFIYANHTLDIGDVYTPSLLFKQKNNIIAGPEAFSIFGIKTIVAMLGALPLPSTLKGARRFLEAIKHKIEKGETITIYPEAHIWPYYTKIRNFKDASFGYPVTMNCPTICVTNTFVPHKQRYKLITHVDGPFYPDLNLDRKASRTKLRDQIYETMLNRSMEVEQYEKNRYIKLD
ncbi:MAG: glycosyltransferase, partial [Erysipelotrichia bacterium]|nr:glycosyltransferase [Erysipelotrichia bacterium]